MATTDFTANRGDSGATKQENSLLEQVTKDYKYALDHPDWQEIRKQAELDDRALSITGPWKDEDIESRSKSGQERPCIHLDQLSQYTNALVNEAKSNPIAIKAEPAGGMANEKTAELRANRIRAIEYESNASQIRLDAFESMACRGFGYYGVVVDYKAWDSNQRVIRHRGFQNAYSVLIDPDATELDWSDMRFAFVLSRMSREKFQDEYPDAQQTSFGEDVISTGWADHNTVQIAEYWYKKLAKVKLYTIKLPTGQSFTATEKKLKNGIVLPGAAEPVKFEGYTVKDDMFILADGTQWEIVSSRTTLEPEIWQVKTNSVELLTKPEKWPGKWIPIFPLVGKQKYERKGNTVKRIFESYVRKGRDGQMLFDFYVSSEAECVGVTTKTPYKAAAGQLEGYESEWETIHKVPRGFVTYNTITDQGGNPIGPPTRDTFEPPIQALEIGKESARRSMQAAIGSYGVTRLDDTNVKSGIALERLKAQNDMGSYHFIDAFKNMIRHEGKVINDLLDDVEADTQKVGLRTVNGEYSVAEVNGQDPDMQYRLSDEDQHEITISTGLPYQSQREEAQAVGETLLQNIQSIAPIIGQEKATQLIAFVLKMRQLGPEGDKIIKILVPEFGKEMDPKALMAQLEQAMQLAEALAQKVQALEAEKSAKLADIDSKERIAAMEAQLKQLELSIKKYEIDKRTELQAATSLAQMQSNEAQADADRQSAQMKINAVGAPEQQGMRLGQ